MMLGSGFLQDTVDKMAKLPSRQSIFQSGGKFKSGHRLQNTCKPNARKLKVKEIFESVVKKRIVQKRYTLSQVCHYYSYQFPSSNTDLKQIFIYENPC
jgi:hypothetical protein